MERLHARENELRAGRRSKGKRVLGWRKVIAQHFLAVPGKPEALFGRRPTVSATSKWARIAALQLRQDFLEAYRKAISAFREGSRAPLFPWGTWLMRVRYRVKVRGIDLPL